MTKLPTQLQMLAFWVLPPLYRVQHSTNLRPCGLDLRCRLILVLLEVLEEQRTKLVHLILEVGRASPALGRVQQIVRHIGARRGDLKPENVVCFVRALGKLAAVDGIQDRPGVLEGAALATSSGTSSDPAGVEEPCVGAVFLDLLRKHLGVAHGVQREERLRKA